MTPSAPLSPEDLAMWYADQPRQRTTMAILLLLDRRPDPDRLRAAAARAVEAVPRLRQRVVDAPFDLALPRWEDDPTFDLDFHVRRYSLTREVGEEESLEGVFRTIGPIYERPFDRTRPLWELIEIDQPDGRAGVFFRLHHAVADGVGGNSILASLTDDIRDGIPLASPDHKTPGSWNEEALPVRVIRALGNRLEEDTARTRALAGAAWDAIRRPASLLRAGAALGALLEDASYSGNSPLRSFGRSRHLTGVEIPFEPLREVKRRLGGSMIDIMLTAVGGAIGAWHESQGMAEVNELLTLVPVNLRPLADQGTDAGIGNRATGLLVRLPITEKDPLQRLAETRRRVEARKAHPSAEFFPAVAAVGSALPRWLFRSIAFLSSQAVELIVTNVPGIPVARYLAGAEITGAYPFAPVAPHCPVSVALYGYRGRLYVGLDADRTAMAEVGDFREMLVDSFAALVEAAQQEPGR